MKHRTSMHRGKSGYAKHNEHDFMSEKKDVTVRYVAKEMDGTSIDAAEINFYKERYTEMLTKQNEKYIKNRQYARCKTIDEIYQSKRYRPTEEILQYGHVGGEVPDKETFNQMMDDYVSWKQEWSRNHGNRLHVLDYANHFDESTPHCHLREVWDYEDEDGIIKIGQEKAMEQAGISLPDPSKPVSRFNNRSMTFTSMCREKWQDICESYGFEVERVPLPTKKKHETVDEYQSRVNRNSLQERIDRQNQIIERNHAVIENQKREFEELKKAKQEVTKEDKKEVLQQIAEEYREKYGNRFNDFLRWSKEQREKDATRLNGNIRRERDADYERNL